MRATTKLRHLLILEEHSFQSPVLFDYFRPIQPEYAFIYVMYVWLNTTEKQLAQPKECQQASFTKSGNLHNIWITIMEVYSSETVELTTKRSKINEQLSNS